MFYFYILKSKKDAKLYFGYTSDLRKRFKEHNSDSTYATKTRVPLYLVYYEAYASKDEAYKREHNLKLRAKAFKQLLRRISKSLKY